MSKKIFIKTFGCQMNEYDSNRIWDLVSVVVFNKTDKKEEAECFVLNTCHIREKATEKVYDEIGRFKKTISCCFRVCRSSWVWRNDKKGAIYWYGNWTSILS